MQINGLAAGPTMAASEPPEPPPRNPDRINASLHKLGESKTVKSLDTSVTTALKEKTASVNNNKPIRPLLSLDSSVTASTSSPGTTGAAGSTGSGGGGAPAKPTPLVLASKRDLTPSNESSSSPSSSNGSNQTLTPPMTTDSQPLQQQQQQLPHHHQQHRSPAYPGKVAEVAGVTPPQQQQQQQLQQQQLPNGIGGSHCNSTCNSGNAMIHANNSNLIAAGHLAQAPGPAHNNAPSSGGSALNAVDKRNANLSETDQDEPSNVTVNAGLNTNHNLNSNQNLNPKSLVALGPPHSPTSAASAALLLLESCDGNRNDESRFHLHSAPLSEAAMKLREENDRLNTELLRLRRLLELSTDGAVGGVDTTPEMEAVASSEGSAAKERIERLESELRSVKNQLLTMRLERKKLRTDKSDLLGQVKQLCASLQEKEQELRDFIRNYQERVRETETTNAKISGDRDRERFQLLKQARDEAERSLALAQQLSSRDLQLQRLQEQLQEARRQLTGCLSDQESLHSFAPLTPPSAASGMLSQMAAASGMGGGLAGIRGTTEDSGRGNSLSAFSGSLSGGSGATAGDRNSCSNDSGLRNSSDRESTGGELNFSDGTCDNGPCITVDPDSISLVSSQNMYQFGTPKERSPTLSPLNSAAYSRSVEQLGSPVDPEGPGGGAISRKFASASKSGPLGARNGRGGTWGSISRVFARSRNKSKALSADGVTEYADYSWNPLTEEGYAEKLRLLREASQLPIDRWRATQVLAWLEVALGMPQYSARCAENVKSGKVLLELNDVELEAGLGLTHPMHRKKLRLAIEEQRRPEMVRYPLITQLGHTWVATEWLPDIGLPQYAEPFVQSLVDARMLDTLSKKELEKFLGVTRKFHQASIVHGIHVLRIVKYDRQTLAMRRVQSETVDTDPIVWTNQRFIRWVRSIDLGEYADNLKDSGVHGGLVVLEPSFSGDTMATALGIPPSKNIIRRHLNTEFDALILPARYLIYCQMEEFQMEASRQLAKLQGH
ncbi:kazrin isoform X3 [Drosophila ficusphila]|uniref:kazrin isoform X3 n=1 Tax=Drosophila ficusphila TaxID=30025 RepID=UPI0007E68361|nr:kazrin isoform X3 [Drosophila ficusphila]